MLHTALQPPGVTHLFVTMLHTALQPPGVTHLFVTMLHTALEPPCGNTVGVGASH